MKDRPAIVFSLILPSYHAAESLSQQGPALLTYLDGLGKPYEVIVADDGNNDAGQTRRVAQQLGCRYVANPTHQGKGAAVRRGMLAAHGQFRLFTDADIPFELDTIERFLWYLDTKEFHMVVGDRTLEQSRYFQGIPPLRQWGSRLYAFVVGRFVVGGWFDTQCGIKGFRAEVAQDLFGVSRINGFAFDVELFYIALKRNYDIKRLPVQLRCPQDDSCVRVARDGAAMVRDLFVIRWNQLVGRYRPQVPVIRGIDSYTFGQARFSSTEGPG